MRSTKLPAIILVAIWLAGAPLGHAAEATEDDAPQAAPADATDTPAPEAVPAASADDLPTEEIVVTGSRIRRDEFSSASPITVITSEASALAGLLNTADILQTSTIAAGQQIDNSFSGFVTDGGPGARSISLRGLGAQRTLVLVNGKRWGPSGVRGTTNSVDLTAVPSSVVGRYEILKDGASSIYGADAIAGVVNVITRQRIEGFQVNLQGAAPRRGAPEDVGVDATWGTVGDTWSFNVSANYSKTRAMTANDRDWSRCPMRPRRTDQDGDGVLDNTHPETGEPLCFGFLHGFVVSPFGWARFEPSLGTLDPGNPYFDAEGPSAFGIPYYTRTPVHGNDPVNGDPIFDNEGPFYRDERDPGVYQMVPDIELYSVTSFADRDFEIADRSANAYYEFFYNHRSFDSSSGYRQFFPAVPSTNPTNPFGLYGPLGGFGGFTVLPVLPSYELLDPYSGVEVDRVNLFVGLAGDLSESWTYDAHVGYSWSEGTYRGQQFLNDRVQASLNATLDANGNLVCADNSIAGCVPANLFTEDALLRGRLPAEVLNWLRKDTEGETTYKSYQLAGYVTGTLFQMPNNEPVSAVFGLEYRNEDIHDVPDPEAQRNNFWGFTSAGITSGDDTVTELFTEFEVPLLKGLPLVEEFLVNASGRWTDYDSYGDDTTYRVAVDYQVIPSVRLRGTRGTSFRAPDLYEQFLANQRGFVSGLADPCINYGDAYEPGDAVYDNCANQGLPPDLGAEGFPSIESVIGGNPNLLAETSKSWTAGMVYQPERIGASVAFSWFDIAISETVSDPSVGYVLGTCYTSPGLSSAWCSRVGARDVLGFLDEVDASLVNIGQRLSRGFDIDFLYEKEFPSFDLTIDGTVTRLKEHRVELFDDVWDNVGHWGYPEWSAALDLRIDYRDWTVFWRTSFIGDTAEDPVFDPDTTNSDRVHETKDKFYHTVSARWRNTNWDVIGTVRNLFDKDPPAVGDGVPRQETARVFNTLPGVGYPLFGRTFVVQVARRF